MKMKKAKNIDEFINTYPDDVQIILQELRQTIQKAAPQAGQKISYGIPTFTFNGNLVHFSAYEKHIGFYPGAEAIVEFKQGLKPYETAKGTVRFPINQPLPLDLIRKIVLYRIRQTRAKKKS